MPAEHPLISKLARVLVLTKAEAAAALAVPVESVPIKAHQNISREGDKPSRSCLVLDGMVCTSKVIAGGKRQIMAFHIRGDGPDLHSLHLHLLDSDIGPSATAGWRSCSTRICGRSTASTPTWARSSGAPPWWTPPSTASER